MGKTLFKGLTAVLTAGVLAAGVCITGYVSRDPNSGDWFKDKDLANWAWNKSPADEGNTGDGGFEDDGNITTGATPSAGGAIMNEAVNSGGLALFSAAIPAAEFDTYGINPLADTAYTLTATITPAETDNKAVDYTVAWKDASSTWASGKSVSDYITVTQPTDGALTATLTCKQGFEEQIIITVTARDNPGNTATCTVDYAKRVTSKYTIANQLTLDGNTSGTKTWTWAQIPSGNIISPWHVPGTFSETYGVGTISNTVTSHSIEVSASAALKTELAKVFTTSTQSTYYNKTYTFTEVKTSNSDDRFSQGALFADGGLMDTSSGSPCIKQKGMFSFIAGPYDYNEDALVTSSYNKLKTCLQAAAIDFVITVKAEMQYGGTYTATYNVNVSDNSLKTVSTGINLDKSNIIV